MQNPYVRTHSNSSGTKYTGDMTQDAIRTLNEEIVTCTRCRLAETRTHAVPGEGPVPSRVLCIGEAPGKNEDLSGRPFVGRAGTVLEGLLLSIGLTRDRVYITSILKCRPPGNRVPRRDEIASCSGYLDRQVALLSPSVIVPMGQWATEQVFSRYALTAARISDLHGRMFAVTTGTGTLLVFPVYHPAAVTHNPRLKGALEEDFKTLRSVLEREGVV